MKRKYYALFSCDEWKTKSSAELIGIFTEKRLRKVIKQKVKSKDFEYADNAKEIKIKGIYYIKAVLKYGYIQELSINEEL